MAPTVYRNLSAPLPLSAHGSCRSELLLVSSEILNMLGKHHPYDQLSLLCCKAKSPGSLAPKPASLCVGSLGLGALPAHERDGRTMSGLLLTVSVWFATSEAVLRTPLLLIQSIDILPKRIHRSLKVAFYSSRLLPIVSNEHIPHD